LLADFGGEELKSDLVGARFPMTRVKPGFEVLSGKSLLEMEENNGFFMPYFLYACRCVSVRGNEKHYKSNERI
jgi:hypothetical protein